MTSLTSTLLKSGRAALVALTLGVTAVTAMPVQAQSQPSLNFQLGMGNDGNVMSFGFGKNERQRYRPIRECISDREVVRGLRHQGFRNVDVIRNLSRTRVAVVGSWHNREYSMKVNKCTGEVYDIQRLRKHRGQPGFNLQFNF